MKAPTGRSPIAELPIEVRGCLSAPLAKDQIEVHLSVRRGFSTDVDTKEGRRGTRRLFFSLRVKAEDLCNYENQRGVLEVIRFFFYRLLAIVQSCVCDGGNNIYTVCMDLAFVALVPIPLGKSYSFPTCCSC